MGYTVNSIIIKKEINELFEIINDVRNWPELHNYQDVKILENKKFALKYFEKGANAHYIMLTRASVKLTIYVVTTFRRCPHETHPQNSRSLDSDCAAICRTCLFGKQRCP